MDGGSVSKRKLFLHGAFTLAETLNSSYSLSSCWVFSLLSAGEVCVERYPSPVSWIQSRACQHTHPVDDRIRGVSLLAVSLIRSLLHTHARTHTRRHTHTHTSTHTLTPPPLPFQHHQCLCKKTGPWPAPGLLHTVCYGLPV